MKAAPLIALLACIATVPRPVAAQVPGTDVEGMTVTATTVDGSNVERGTTTASVTGIGGGLFEARPLDPLIPG